MKLSVNDILLKVLGLLLLAAAVMKRLCLISRIFCNRSQK
jgi:hypothetical protein